MRIAMWSGPRNISTAMMRSFENRADTEVWDEPFYAHYLQATGIEHPMRAAVLAAGETGWRRIAEACARMPETPNRHGQVPAHFFQKHMTHHMLPHIELGWAEGMAHFFLIRRPESVIASYHARRARFAPEDLGFARQRELYEEIAALTGRAPPVIESDSVLADPPGMLGRLCDALGIAFDPAMLSWPAGQRATDGVWGAHWYKAVQASTGFASPPKRPELPAHLSDLAKSLRPDYEAMRAHAL